MSIPGNFPVLALLCLPYSQSVLLTQNLFLHYFCQDWSFCCPTLHAWVSKTNSFTLLYAWIGWHFLVTWLPSTRVCTPHTFSPLWIYLLGSHTPLNIFFTNSAWLLKCLPRILSTVRTLLQMAFPLHICMKNHIQNAYMKIPEESMFPRCRSLEMTAPSKLKKTCQKRYEMIWWLSSLCSPY